MLTEVLNLVSPIISGALIFFVLRLIKDLDTTKTACDLLITKLEVMTTVNVEMNKKIEISQEDIRVLSERSHMFFNKLVEIKSAAQHAGWKVSDNWDFPSRTRN